MPASSPSEKTKDGTQVTDCPKFRPLGEGSYPESLGDFPELCTCAWRSGLVHRAGQQASPGLCRATTAANSAAATPLAGWFGVEPARSVRPRLHHHHHHQTPGETPPPPMPAKAATKQHAGGLPVPAGVPRKTAAGDRSARRPGLRAARAQTVSSKSNPPPPPPPPPTPAAAQAPGAPSRPSGPRQSGSGDLITGRRGPAGARAARFKHRGDSADYMREYRDRHSLRLVGRDGSPLNDGTAAFGKSLPDPYDFKSDNLRRVYSRLYEYMKRRPKPSYDVNMPIAIERSYDDIVPATDNNVVDDKDATTEDMFAISDQPSTNYSKFFSPAFRRPKDLTFQPYISGNATASPPAKAPTANQAAATSYYHLHREEGQEERKAFPSIFKEAGHRSQPAAGGRDSSDLWPVGERADTPPRHGVASGLDIRLLRPKTVTGSGAPNGSIVTNGAPNGNATATRPFSQEAPTAARRKPNIMSADFDAAMLQFLQKAKQNLESVRERRARREAQDRGRPAAGRRRADLAVGPGKTTALRPGTTAVDARRINLGVSQS